jgi:hypothetical protein
MIRRCMAVDMGIMMFHFAEPEQQEVNLFWHWRAAGSQSGPEYAHGLANDLSTALSPFLRPRHFTPLQPTPGQMNTVPALSASPRTHSVAGCTPSVSLGA